MLKIGYLGIVVQVIMCGHNYDFHDTTLTLSTDTLSTLTFFPLNLQESASRENYR